jgi:phosphohistidine phosphatase SixA
MPAVKRLNAGLIAAVAAALAGIAVAATASAEPATWGALKGSGKVALIRHAATAGGAGDPAGFRLEDCATQRNLTEKGRADARRLGEQFREHGIVVGRVLSSRWCRCKDTAALMEVGPLEIAPTFDNAFTFRDRLRELTEGARAIIGAWTGPGTLVIVSHGANILPLVGFQPAEGEMVVVEPAPAAERLRVLGSVRPPQ